MTSLDLPSCLIPYLSFEEFTKYSKRTEENTHTKVVKKEEWNKWQSVTKTANRGIATKYWLLTECQKHWKLLKNVSGSSVHGIGFSTYFKVSFMFLLLLLFIIFNSTLWFVVNTFICFWCLGIFNIYIYLVQSKYLKMCLELTTLKFLKLQICRIT